MNKTYYDEYYDTHMLLKLVHKPIWCHITKRIKSRPTPQI